MNKLDEIIIVYVYEYMFEKDCDVECHTKELVKQFIKRLHMV